MDEVPAPDIYADVVNRAVGRALCEEHEVADAQVFLFDRRAAGGLIARDPGDISAEMPHDVLGITGTVEPFGRGAAPFIPDAYELLGV